MTRRVASLSTPSTSISRLLSSGRVCLRCGGWLSLALIAALIVGVSLPSSASAAITLVDSGANFLTAGANPTDNAVTVSVGANVIVVDLAWRSGTDQSAGGSPPTVTYNGVPLTSASTAYGVAGTFVNSAVYYLYAPATGSNTLHVDYGAGVSSGVINAFSLGGVDTSVAPNLTPGWTATTVTEGSPVALAASLSNLTPGAWVVSSTDYRKGNAALLNAFITDGTGTLNTTGAGGTVANGNNWNVADGNIVAAGVLVTNVTSSRLSIQEAGGDLSGTHFNMAAAAFTPSTLTWTGGASNNWNTADANWSGPSTTYSDGSSVTFSDSGALSPIAIQAGGVLPSSVLFTNNANARTINGPGGIGGTAGVYVLGGGNVTFGGANTYSGPTSLVRGTLRINNANSLQNSTINIATGGTLNFGTGVGTFNAGGLSGDGTINLADTGATPVTLVVGANNASSSFSGSVSGGTLTKAGSGTLTLSGSSSNTTTKITSGTLRMGLVPGALNVSVYTGIPNATAGFSSLPAMLAFLPANSTSTTRALTTDKTNLDYDNYNFTDVAHGGAPFNQAGPTTGNYGVLDADNIGAAWSGYINIKTAGNYVFDTRSDDGSMVWIDGGDGITPNNGVPAVNNNFYQGQTTRSSGSIALTAGLHKIDLGFYEGGGGAGVTFTYQGPDTGGAKALIPANVLSAPNLNQSLTGTQVLMSSNTTFDIGPNIVTIGSLAEDVGATGHQVLLAGGSLTTGDASNTTFSGVISGTGDLTKVGTGRFTLGAANTFAGTTLISNGTLQINNANSLQNSVVNVDTTGGGVLAFGTGVPSFNLGGLSGTGTISMQNTAAGGINLVLGSSANSEFDGILTGAGGITKVGTGTLTLGGANTYTGTTTIQAGTLAAGGPDTPGTSGPFGKATTAGSIVFGGGALQYTAGNQQDYSSRFSTAGQAYKIDINGQLVTFATNLNGAGNSMTVLSTAGGGVLNLTGSNSFTAGVNLNGGEIGLGSANAIGATGTILGTGGYLQYSASNTTDYSPRFGTAANNVIGIDTNGQNVTFNTNYSSSGGSLLVNDQGPGNGTLTLNSVNDHSGATRISRGTLQINNANSLHNSIVTPDGGNLTFKDLVTTFNFGGLAGTGTIVMSDIANQPVNLVVGGSGASSSFAGTLSGGGNLTKAGAGTLTLSGANTVSNTTKITGGTLRIQSAFTGLFEGRVDGGFNTTDPNPNTSRQSSARYANIADSGTAYPNTGGAWADNTTFVYSGLLNNASSNNVTWTFLEHFDDNVLLTIDGKVVLNDTAWNNPTSANYTLTPGAHSFELRLGEGGGGVGPSLGDGSWATDFALGFAVDTQGRNQQVPGNYTSLVDPGDGSLLRAVNPNAVLPATSQIVMSSNTTFDVGGGPVTIASLTQDVGATGHQVVIPGGTLTLGDSTDFTFTGVISGNLGNLTKVGSGRLTLTNANTYSGTTLIQAGTVQANNANSLAGTTVNVVPLDPDGNPTGAALNFGAGPTTFNLGGLAGSGTINMANVSSGTVNLNVGGNNQSTTFTGQLTGSGSLTKSGTGTLTFAGNYASAQPIAITGGTFRVSSAASLTVSIYNMNPGSQNTQFDTLAHIGAYLATGTPTVTTPTNDKTDLNYSNNGYGGNAPFNALGSTTGNYGAAFADTITAYFTGKIKISTGGTYQFRTTSDDGSMVFLDGVDAPVVNNNFYQGATTRSGSVSLPAGFHQIDLGFYEGGGGAGVLYEYNGPDTGNNWVAIPNTVLFNPTTSAPFATTQSIVMSSNTTFDVSSISTGILDIGSLSDAAGSPTGHQVVLGTTTLRINDNAADATFSGAIHGAGSLVKNGSKTLTLAGVSDYSGATTVSNGKLVLKSGSGLGNTAISVASGATLAPQPNTGVTIATGSTGSLSLAAGSIFDMSGDSAAGTFSVGGNLAMTGPLSMKFDIGTDGGGATVLDKLAVGGTAADTGTASITISGFGSTNLTNGLYPLITATSGLTTGSFTLTNSTIVVNGTLYNLRLIGSGSAEKLRVATPGTDGSWIQTGSGSFSWGTAGNWASGLIPGVAGDSATFGSANGNAQTVTLDQNRALAVLTFSNAGGGTYNITGGAGPFSLTLDGFGAGAVVSNLTGNNTISADLKVNDATSSAIDASSGTTLTLSGVISSTGPVVIGGSGGTGTVVLSNTNTFNGGLAVAGGTVQVPTINNASTNGPLGNQTSVTMGAAGNSIGTIDYAGGSLSTNMPFIMAAGGGGSFKIDNAATAVTLSANVTGAGSLGTSGPGTLILSGAGNTFSGGLNVNGGTVRANNANSGVIGSGNVSFGAAGTTLDLNGNSPTTGFLSSTGGNGLVTNNAASGTATLTLSSAGLASFSGSINKGATADISLVITGGGGQELTGASNFTGNVAIQNGALQIGAGGSLAAANSVTLGSGANSGVLSLGNGSGSVNQAISSLSVSGTGGSNRVVGGAATVSNLTINNTAPATYSSTLFGASGTNRNNLSITAGGPGSITLSADNTYNGGTTVNAGVTLNLGSVDYRGTTAAGTGDLRLAGGTLGLRSNGHGALSISMYNTAPVNPDNTQFNSLAALNTYLGGFTPTVAATNDKTNLDYSDNGYGDGAMFNILGPTTGNYGFGPINQFAAHWTGSIKITTAGNYTFRTTSDDGSLVWLDGVDAPVTNNNAYQGPTLLTGNATALPAGDHQIDLAFYEGGGGNGVLFEYNGPDTGNNWVPVPTSVLSHTPTNQTWANNVVVTANSSIDITNNLTASVGAASLGNATLNVGSSDGSTNPYTLTFNGHSTLTGNATINIANSAGGGTGQVNLSSIGETGGSHSLTKTGPGVLSLSGNGTYSGGTVLTASTGLAIANNGGALGTGPVTLNNATNLRLVATGNLSVVSPTIGGFNNGAGWAASNDAGGGLPAAFSGDTLTLTASQNGQSRSVFYNTPQAVNANFSVGFVYQATNGSGNPADGVTFMLQNDARGTTALGGGGGALGYSGITPSAAYEINLYNPNTRGTGFTANGAITNPYTPVGFELLGNPISVTLQYDSTALTVTENLKDLVTGDTYTNVITLPAALNDPGALGADTAILGFSGATGGENATQTISNFQFGYSGVSANSIYNNDIIVTASSNSTIEVSALSPSDTAIMGKLTMGAAGTLNKTGTGILGVNGAPSLGNGASVNVNTGRLKFTNTAGAATIGTGVTATVADGAALELAGSVSSLSDPTGALKRVHVVNNGDQATGGLIVSGTNQHTGGIDGTGDTTVNDGASLTADHIIQDALVIGGANAVVTIAASDSSGNPTAGSLAALGNSSPIAVGGSSLITSGAGASSSSLGGLGSLSLGGSTAAVPEPSSIVLVVLGGAACLVAALRRRRNPK